LAAIQAPAGDRRRQWPEGGLGACDVISSRFERILDVANFVFQLIDAVTGGGPNQLWVSDITYVTIAISLGKAQFSLRQRLDAATGL